MSAFPKRDGDVSSDVARVVAGITAALMADVLPGHGNGVVVLDQFDVCWGSTSVSTTLLQYRIDSHAIDLAMCYEPATALLAYQSCLHAISVLWAVANAVRDVDFATCESLYYASNRADRVRLADAFSWQTQHGFPVRWLSHAELRDKYASIAPAAIFSSLATRVDPNRLASRLLRRKQQKGTCVFSRTPVKSITTTTRSVQVTRDNDMSIRTRHTVIARGYDAQCRLRQRIAKNRNSYAYIRDPVDHAKLGWMADTLLWESVRPYLYLRSSGDGRLLMGGKAGVRDIAARRDRLVDRKATILQRKVSRSVPHLQAQPAFTWVRTFAEASAVCRCSVAIRSTGRA